MERYFCFNLVFLSPITNFNLFHLSQLDTRWTHFFCRIKIWLRQDWIQKHALWNLFSHLDSIKLLQFFQFWLMRSIIKNRKISLLKHQLTISLKTKTPRRMNCLRQFATVTASLGISRLRAIFTRREIYKLFLWCANPNILIRIVILLLWTGFIQNLIDFIGRIMATFQARKIDKLLRVNHRFFMNQVIFYRVVWNPKSIEALNIILLIVQSCLTKCGIILLVHLLKIFCKYKILTY